MHKRLRLARLSSIVPGIKSKSRDEESILRGVICYVEELQKQVKDIRSDIARLQSNISETDHKNTARTATVVTTFAYDMTNDIRQASDEHGDDKEVIQKEVFEAEYNSQADMLQVLHVKEVKQENG